MITKALLGMQKAIHSIIQVTRNSSTENETNYFLIRTYVRVYCTDTRTYVCMYVCTYACTVLTYVYADVCVHIIVEAYCQCIVS